MAEDLFKVVTTEYWLNPGTDQARRAEKVSPGAVAVRRTSKKWYGRVGGRRVPLSPNKAAARVMLADLIKRAALESAGVKDDFAVPRSVPIVCPLCGSTGRTKAGESCACPGGSHLSDYRRGLEAKDKNPRYVCQVVSHCAAVFDGTGAAYIAEVDANQVERYLADLRQRTGVGISTTNHYLTSAKGFTRWLTRTRPARWPSDPLACLANLNAETDVRRERRAADVDEAARLLSAALGSTDVFRGLTGEDRYRLYAVALQSGLRAGELASLTPESFILDGQSPFIRLEAKRSKRRRLDHQPIPRELAESLRPWLSTKPRGQPVWPGTWHKRAFVMIKRDLAVARAAWLEEAPTAAERQRREALDYLLYEDSSGRTFDFHSCRHSFISLLAQSGVHPKTAQELARHSSIDLTMNAYTHLRLSDRAAAVETLPSLLSGPSRGQPMAATGTDGGARLRPACAPDAPGGPRLSEVGQGQGAEGGNANRPQPLESGEVAGGCLRLSRVGEGVGEGTRNPDFQSTNQPAGKGALLFKQAGWGDGNVSRAGPMRGRVEGVRATMEAPSRDPHRQRSGSLDPVPLRWRSCTARIRGVPSPAACRADARSTAGAQEASAWSDRAAVSQARA
jgi:integrase